VIISLNRINQSIFVMETALLMEAASTSETSVKFYHTTRRNNPEDSHLHTGLRENLKSYLDSSRLGWDPMACSCEPLASVKGAEFLG
jgi:hypothetical protein